MKKIYTHWKKVLTFLPALLLLQSLAFAQMTVQIGSGTATNSYLPMYYLYGYNYTQTIYTAQELMGGGMYSSGEITKIRYKPTSNASTSLWKDWEVYVGNTTKTTFTSNTDWVVVGSMTQVFDGVLPTNVVSNTWMEIDLTLPFVWDGTSNLVVGIREKTPSYGGSPNWASYTGAGSNRGIYYYSDGTNPNPASPPSASNRTNNLAQIQFEWESNLPTCTGTPVAGTIPSILEICANEGFSIALTGAVLNSSDIAGQWQSRVLPGGTWANIVGATGFGLSVPNGVAVETAYRFILTCTSSNMSDTTNALETDFLPANVCYCLPSTSSTSYFIDSFSTTGAIQNVINGGTGMGPNGFQSFVATDTIGQMQTQDVSFRIKGNSSNSAGAKIWVDWNQNGVYDTNEQVFVTSTYSNIHQGTFTVPLTATPGVTRLRVGWHGTSTTGPTGPCQTGMNGEFEDYAFEVLPLPDCTTLTTPANWSVEVDQDSLCVSGDVNLTVNEWILGSNVTYQFQESTDGTTWNNIGTASATAEASVIGVNVETYFRVKWLCNNVEISTSALDTVFINDPEIISTTGAQRCGPGVVTLSANVGPGMTAKWFEDPNDQLPVFEGANFTTPFLPGTTTYYVAAATSTTPQPELYVGNGTGTTGSSPQPFYTTYWGSKNQYMIKASELQALGYTAGMITDVVFDVVGATGLDLEDFEVKMGLTTATALTSTFITTGMQTVYTATGTEVLTANTEKIFSLDNYYLWDGVSNLIIETCFNNSNWSGGHTVRYTTNLGFNASTYQYGDNANVCPQTSGYTVTSRPNIKLKMTKGCESNREAVVATINPAAPIAGDVQEVICEDDIVQITIPTGINDYPTITYTPIANLYTDAQATVPYVLGTHASSLYFKGDVAGEHFVYIEGTNTITDCNGVDTLQIFVQPGDPVLHTMNDTICYGEDLEIQLLPEDGYAPNSIQWQTSTDGTNWTDIAGATTQELLVPNITANGFYRPLINNSVGTCATTQKTIIVSDPDILTVQDGETCGPGPVTLSATATAGSQIAWYDDINSGMPIHVGPTYTTSTIGTSTPYYVAAFVGGGESPDEFVGSGNNTFTSTPQPFHTLYWGNKNQYLIHADELTALGYSAGNITELIFDVIGASGMALSNFEVKMENTTLTTLTTTFQTGLQTVYTAVGNETLTANTEKVFLLDNPFFWDGTSNLIVETCFNNTGWSSGHSVRGTQNLGFNANTNTSSDNATVCTQTSGSTMTSRPNMKFKIDSGCRSTKTEVMAYVRPGVNLNLPNTLNLCTSPQSPGQLDAGSHPDNVTYLWDNNSTDRYRTVLQSGTYSVTVTNEFGCASSDTVEVTIRHNPIVDLGPDTTLCLGGELELDAGPDGDVYTWSNGTLGRYNTITTPGTYTVLVEAPNGCVVIDTINITFSNQEVANIDGISANSIGQNAFKFSAINPQNVTEYFWSFGDGNFSAAAEPTHTYANKGNYVVVLEAGNDCGVLTDSISTHIVSIGEKDKGDHSITVYPNPTKGNVTIKNTSDYRMLAISISDATGRTLQKMDINEVNDYFSKDVDLANYADGMYWIHIHTEHGVFTKKVNLVKQ